MPDPTVSSQPDEAAIAAEMERKYAIPAPAAPISSVAPAMPAPAPKAAPKSDEEIAAEMERRYAHAPDFGRDYTASAEDIKAKQASQPTPTYEQDISLGPVQTRMRADNAVWLDKTKGLKEGVPEGWYYSKTGWGDLSKAQLYPAPSTYTPPAVSTGNAEKVSESAAQEQAFNKSLNDLNYALGPIQAATPAQAEAVRQERERVARENAGKSAFGSLLASNAKSVAGVLSAPANLADTATALGEAVTGPWDPNATAERIKDIWLKPGAGTSGAMQRYFGGGQLTGVSPQLIDPETGKPFNNPDRGLIGQEEINQVASMPGELLKFETLNSAGEAAGLNPVQAQRATAAVVATQGGPAAFQQAKAEGATDAQAFNKALGSAGLQYLLMGHAPAPTPAKTALGEAGQMVGRAGLLGGGLAVGENVLSLPYDPNRPLTQGVVGGMAQMLPWEALHGLPAIQEAYERDGGLIGPRQVEGSFTRDSGLPMDWQAGEQGPQKYEVARNLQLEPPTPYHTPVETSPSAKASSDFADTLARFNELKSKLRAGQLTPDESMELNKIHDFMGKQALLGGSLDDPLPGVMNLQGFNEAVEKEEPTHFVSMDVDNFKAVNDLVGHQAGNEILKLLAQPLADHLQRFHIARTGGDEFMGAGSDPEELRAAFEQAQKELANTNVTVTDNDGNSWQINGIGISFGIGDKRESADSALIQSKQEREAAGERVNSMEVRRRLTERGPDRRGADIGIAGRSIPFPTTLPEGATQEPGRIYRVERGAPKAVGSPEGAPAGGGEDRQNQDRGPIPQEPAGGAGSPKGQPPAAQPAGDLTGAGLGGGRPQGPAPAEAGGTLPTGEAGAGGLPATSSEPGQEGKPVTLNYIDHNGEKQEVPVTDPRHQAELADIEKQFEEHKQAIAYLHSGDTMEDKQERARLYRRAADSYARAKADLHYKMEDEARNGAPIPTPKGMSAADGTPEAQQARAELRAHTQNAIDQLNASETVDKNQSVGQQYENARTQAGAVRKAMLPLLRMIDKISPRDQRDLRNYIETRGNTPLDPSLQKWADEVAMPLLGKVKETFLRINALNGITDPKQAEDDATAYVMRRRLPTGKTEPPTLWQRALQGLGAWEAPGEEKQTFDTTTGMPLSDRSLEARSRHIMLGPNGERGDVVSLSRRGGLAKVEAGGNEGKQYTRKNAGELLGSRLVGPQGRMERAMDRAKATLEDLTQRLPKRLEAEADKLASRSQALSDAVKRIIQFNSMGQGPEMRRIIDERYEIEEAVKRGDYSLLTERDPKLKQAQDAFESAVGRKLYGETDDYRAKLEEAEKRIAMAKTPAEKERFEAKRASLLESYNEAAEKMGSINLKDLIESDPDLKAKQDALKDRFTSSLDKWRDENAAKAQALANRVARNEKFEGDLSEKAKAAQDKAYFNNEEAERLRKKYEHLNPEDAMRAIAAEEAHRGDIEAATRELTGEETKQRPGRMTAALAKLDAAREEAAKAAAPFKGMNPEDKVYTDKEGNLYRLGQARTEEIEAQTGDRYDPNVLHNLVDKAVKLSDVARNLDLVNNWKEQGVPAYDEKGDKLPPPDGYAMTAYKGPGFDKIYLPKEAALHLDHLQMDLERGQSPDGLLKGLKNLAGLAVRSVFYNPLGHMLNTATHYMVAKGWKNFNPVDVGESAKGVFDAWKSIAAGDKKALDWANHGLPMMTLRDSGTEYAKFINDRFKSEIENAPPKQLDSLAAKLGMGAADLIKAVYKHSSDALWMADDAMRMNLAESVQKAHPEWTKEQVAYVVNQHVASYQSPKGAPVWMRQAHENPLFVFSRYHQFIAQDFFHNLKGLLVPGAVKDSQGKPLTTKSEAYVENLGRVATTALMMVALKPAFDKMLQSILGDKYKFRFVGPMAVPAALMGAAANTVPGQKLLENVPEGTRKNLFDRPLTMSEAMTRIAMPSPAANMGIEALTGRVPYSGKRVDAAGMAKDALGTLAPVRQAMDYASDRRTGKDFLASQISAGRRASQATELAKRFQGDAFGSGAMSPEDQEIMKAKMLLKEEGSGYKPGSKEETALIQRIVKQGHVTDKAASAAVAQSHLSPEDALAARIKTLKGTDAPDQAMQVWRLATKSERAAIRNDVSDVINRPINKGTPAQAAEAKKLMVEFSRSARNP